ncbi:MAG TPA: FAD/NAD(P)-binding oxidoreductase [Nitrososphaeraceae archaeon]|jgi:sulfide:quinone oxidoreductase
MATAKQVLILGGGFGGLVSANLIRKGLRKEECVITLVDKSRYFMMGLVNLWILSGNRKLEDSQVDLDNLQKKGIIFLNDEITSIDASEKSVTTRASNKLKCDYLIVALGAELAPERISGFENYDESCFNAYDSKQATRLREKILSIKRGRIVVCIADLPYKCPPAPYEVSLLLNDILVKNGTRDSIELDMYVPTPIALPVAGPQMSQNVVNLLNDNHIKFHTSHKIKKVLDKKTIEFENGNKTNYDVLVVIPPHQIPPVIKNSDLLEAEQRWINVDKFSLRTKHNNVFAIGDVTEIRLDKNTTIPKAGIFAEGEAKAVSFQIINEIKNSYLNYDKAHIQFDGKGHCFMEIGDKKAGYIDADFYNEAGPTTRLVAPSEEFYQKKLDFEKSRVNEWLTP